MVASPSCHSDSSSASVVASTTSAIKAMSLTTDTTTTMSKSRGRSEDYRNVHFDTSKNVIHLIPHCQEDMSSKQRRALWWQYNDFQSFRLASKTAACDLRLETAVCGPIDRGYTAAHFLATDVCDCESVLYVELQDVEVYAQDLVRWTCRHHSCRGVEHWCSRSHWKARGNVMRVAQASVLDVASPARGGLSSAASSSLTASHATDEEQDRMAHDYAHQGRPARILARLLGQADWVAAKQVHEEGVATTTTTEDRTWQCMFE